jgi:signal transduction histidine kinase
MKKHKFFPWLMVLISICGMFALATWNYYTAEQAIMQRHQVWVERIVVQLNAVRKNRLDEVRAWAPGEKADLKTLADRDPSVAALFFNDTESHHERSWLNPAFAAVLSPLDPRLVAQELDALRLHKPVSGTVLYFNNTYFSTVIYPVDEFRVLVVSFEDHALGALLAQQTEFWQLQNFVFDRQGNSIYSHGDDGLIRPMLAKVLSTAIDAHNGWFKLEGRQRFSWAATYHWSESMDWLFVLAEPALWLYAPLVLFLISLIGMSILAYLPWRASVTLQDLSWKQDLEEFAQQSDRFIRGKDGVLGDPKEKLESLVPVVHTLRWLMPQWKKAESFPRELALERKLVSLLIESLPEGILFFNAQGNLQLGNELGKVFLTLQQESGKEVKTVGSMQIPRGFLEPYLEPVFGGEQRTLGKEVEVSWADGKHLYRVWVEAVQTQDDRSDGFIVVIRDITFRKQWEYVQEQVLSGITHDLRGPLSAVMGYLDLMKRQVKEETSPKLVEYIRLAREGGQRLSQMVSDILDVVRFEQGKIDLQTQPVSVEDIFKRLQDTYGVNASQKNVQLLFEGVGPTGMFVTADPKLLERVFDNLVGNAIKFTPTGGTITVSAQRQSGRVQFLIKDTGRGIPKEAQSRIFDKFQQVRPGDRAGGYGLGLAVAKFIVDAHKGEIHVESEVGKGSAFNFSIPDAEPTLKTLEPTPPATA